MTDGDQDGVDAALAHLHDREAELRDLTNGWTDPVVGVTYDLAVDPDGDLADDLDEDLADDLEIFESHGYTQFVTREGGSLSATYRKLAPDGDDSPAVLIRAYSGKQQADALAAFEADAIDLATRGYHPTTQSWASGQWGCGAFLVAILLCFVLVGILVFIYMLLVKPEGTLTVTYERPEEDAARASVARATPRTRAAEHRSLAARLAELDEARDVGLISPGEYASRRSRILDES